MYQKLGLNWTTAGIKPRLKLDPNWKKNKIKTGLKCSESGLNLSYIWTKCGLELDEDWSIKTQVYHELRLDDFCSCLRVLSVYVCVWGWVCVCFVCAVVCARAGSEGGDRRRHGRTRDQSPGAGADAAGAHQRTQIQVSLQ